MLDAKLVVVGGDAKSAEVRLNLPTVIGRGKGVGLTVPHALVSRRHTEIFERDGKLFVRDLGSLNGTFVNNTRIESEQPLEPNQLLTLGNITFRAIYETAESANAAADARASESTATTFGNETVTIQEVETKAPNKKSDAIEVVESGNQPASSLSNLLSFDETVPLDSSRKESPSPQSKSAEAENVPKTKPQTRASEKTVSEPISNPAAEDKDSVIDESDVSDPTGDTHKSSASPNSANDQSEVVVIETDGNPAEKSVSLSGLDSLPTGQPAASFAGNLDLGDDANPSVSQVEPVEIDLGEEPAPKVDDDSMLGSFLRKLPR